MAGTFDLGAMLAEPQLNADYKKAAEVDALIKQSAMQAQENLYNMAMGFKKMRDEKLYAALGYENFGDYCEKETGMKRRNVYNYIAIAEKLPQEFVHSSAQIGIKKLTLLTTLDDEQREVITENTDLENTSVRELKEKIKQLQKENNSLINQSNNKKDEQEITQLREKLSEQQNNTKEKEVEIASLEKRILSLTEQAKNDSANIKKLKFVNMQFQDKNYDLNKKIKELENRPVEVAVVDNSEEVAEEIENLKEQLEQAQNELKNAQSKPVADEVIRYKAALKGTEKALHELLLASMNYNGNTYEVTSLIDSFTNDFKKYMDEKNKEKE